MIYANASRFISVIYSISIISRCASAHRAFFFIPPRLLLHLITNVLNKCAGGSAGQNQEHIYIFFIFLSSLKIPYPKHDKILCFRADTYFSSFITLKIRYLHIARFSYKNVRFVQKGTKMHFVRKTMILYQKVHHFVRG